MGSKDTLLYEWVWWGVLSHQPADTLPYDYSRKLLPVVAPSDELWSVAGKYSLVCCFSTYTQENGEVNK